jgi:hypothetical protein
MSDIFRQKNSSTHRPACAYAWYLLGLLRHVSLIRLLQTSEHMYLTHIFDSLHFYSTVQSVQPFPSVYSRKTVPSNYFDSLYSVLADYSVDTCFILGLKRTVITFVAT